MITAILLIAGVLLIGISIASSIYLMKPSEKDDVEEGAVQHKVNNINIDNWNRTIPSARKDNQQGEGVLVPHDTHRSTDNIPIG